MNADLLNPLVSAAGAVALVFLGAVGSDWQTRRTEARKQLADDQAELQAQADELLAAVIAVKVAGNMHDRGVGGWRTRLIVSAHALIRATAARERAGQGLPGFLAQTGEMVAVLRQWDQEFSAAADRLTAPLSRLGAAAAPLIRRPEQALAEAAQNVLAAVVDRFDDEEVATQALTAFRRELLLVLDAPAAPRRRLSLRRSSDS
ncbi:hypothetical protein ACWDGI_41790 [Streptomyces sp. NPDC001220]